MDNLPSALRQRTEFGFVTDVGDKKTSDKSPPLPPLANGFISEPDQNTKEAVHSSDNQQHLPRLDKDKHVAKVMVKGKAQTDDMLVIGHHVSSSLPNLTRSQTTLDGTAMKEQRKVNPVEQPTDKNSKLIKKLSQTLPVHLYRKAEEKIRVITNTEAIYKNKQKLLQQHKAMLHNKVLDDPRWTKLESSLSENKDKGGSPHGKISYVTFSVGTNPSSKRF